MKPGKMVRVFTAILSLFLWATVHSFASAAELKFSATNYPPYDIEDHPDGLRGFDVEVVEAVFKQAGIDASVIFQPWKRMMVDLERGTLTGAVTCADAPKKRPFAYVSDPISQDRMAFITRKDFSGTLTSFDDLRGLKVIAVADYISEKELTDLNIEHDLVWSMEQGLDALAKRETIEVFYVGWESAAYLAKSMGYGDTFSYQVNTDLQTRKFHVCFSKLWPGYEELTERFNAGLRIVRESGLFDTIRAKYF